MPNFNLALPISTVFLIGACDESAPGDAPDRGEGLVEFRDGAPGTGGGSTVLNTGKLNFNGLPIRDFDRRGGLRVYDDARETNVAFLGVRVVENGGLVDDFPAKGSDIEALPNGLRINDRIYTPGALVGSEWRFRVSGYKWAQEDVMIGITAAAVANVPGGTNVPVYNFSFNGVPLLDVGDSVCSAVDVLTEWQVPYKNQTPEFQAKYAAALYPNVRVDEAGVVTADPSSIYFACLSGAIGKASLWGYPPWVSTYQNMSGAQQLQAVSRAIRADYCGDGTTHTEDGTPIQIRDRFRPGFEDPYEATEAIWNGSRSACRVTHGRIEPGANYSCGGAVTADCDQLASQWLGGAPAFMWTKLDPETTPESTKTGCGTTSTTTGCNDPGIEATVCGADPYCCQVEWDQICVDQVTSLSAAGDACCAANGGPGCGSASVSGCVGVHDSYCVNNYWDSLCALEVEHLSCGMCG